MYRGERRSFHSKIKQSSEVERAFVAAARQSTVDRASLDQSISPSRGARFLPSSIAATRFSRCRKPWRRRRRRAPPRARRASTRAPRCTCSTVSSPQKRSVRVEPAGEARGRRRRAAGRRSSSRRAGCGRRGAARRPPARGARGERWRAGRARTSEARLAAARRSPRRRARRRSPAPPSRRRDASRRATTSSPSAERDGDDERPVQDAHQRVPDGERPAPSPRRRRGGAGRRAVSLRRGHDLEGLRMEEGLDRIVLGVLAVDLVAAVGDLDAADLPALVLELALQVGLRLPFLLRDRLALLGVLGEGGAAGEGAARATMRVKADRFMAVPFGGVEERRERVRRRPTGAAGCGTCR